MDSDSQNSKLVLIVAHYLAVKEFTLIAREFLAQENYSARLVLLSDENKKEAINYNFPETSCSTFESFIDSENPRPAKSEFLNKYSDINWSELAASERSFSDFSFLLNSTGFRIEGNDYVTSLLYNMGAFFDSLIQTYHPCALITAFGDNIFTHTAISIAESNDIHVVLPQSSYLNEGGNMEGGYLGSTRFLESFDMINSYLSYQKRDLERVEIDRAEKFAEELIRYDGVKTLSYIYKKDNFEKALSPQVSNIFSYVIQNRKLNANVAFYKIDVIRKIKANFLRMYRRKRLDMFLRKQYGEIPGKAVFFPMHFQPEASTLVNGIWYSNQIALIEDISKSLPLGYVLVVKEHPRGRGMRPFWQYQHIENLYNVIISDLPSKEIIRRCDAVITISGSVGFEALALDKPVIVLGRTFHSYSELYYRVKCAKELFSVFKRILLEKEFELIADRRNKIRKYFLSYIDSIYPFYPVGENATKLVPMIIKNMDIDRKQASNWLKTIYYSD